MSLKYQPKGALASAMTKLCKVAQDRGLMCSIAITDGQTGDLWLSLDPAWSAIQAARRDGDITASVKPSDGDTPRTAAGLAVLLNAVTQHQTGIMEVMNEFREARFPEKKRIIEP